MIYDKVGHLLNGQTHAAGVEARSCRIISLHACVWATNADYTMTPAYFSLKLTLSVVVGRHSRIFFFSKGFFKYFPALNSRYAIFAPTESFKIIFRQPVWGCFIICALL